jgi:hypothetical protein
MVPMVDTVAGAHGMLPTAWCCALGGLGGTADFGQRGYGWPRAQLVDHPIGW